jgi:cbb3-type cytochrome oxidase subunit 3
MDYQKAIKLHKTVEKFWLIVLIISTLLTAYYWFSEGVEANKFMIVIPTLAAIWYLFRRGFRKRLERQLAEHEAGK